jgi:hypothetical protein
LMNSLRKRWHRKFSIPNYDHQVDLGRKRQSGYL